MALTTAEAFAASNILTDWPDHYDYDQLLTAVESGCDDDVIVWEAFENEIPSDLAQIIDDMRVNFLVNVANMTESLRQAIKNGDPMTIADQLMSLEYKLGV